MKDKYLDIETRLNNVLKMLNTAFSFDERKEVQGFIDVGEYGVALTTLNDIITEEEKVVTQDVYSYIDEIQQLMDNDK